MKDEIIVKEYPTDKPGTFLVVRMYYSKGGMNYFAGASEPRGYYLSVGPEEIRDGMRSFAMFSGVKHLVLRVERKSPKAQATALKLVADGEGKQRLLNEMCAKHKLTIDLVAAMDK